MKKYLCIIFVAFVITGAFSLGDMAIATLSRSGDVVIDSDTGLEWLIMPKTVNKSPDKIIAGQYPDLAGQGWVHATILQIKTLFMHAGMSEPFDGGFTPWNFSAANSLMDLMGGSTYFVDSQWGRTYGVQAFTAERPSLNLVYPAYLMIALPHYPNPGDEVGAALFPSFGVPSTIVSPGWGNWLVRPHADTTAPTLAPFSNKTVLWPPDHKMVEVMIQARASDDSGGPVTLAATVSSNEPDNGLGDGDTAPDWTTPSIDQETGLITLQLRAERAGTGMGRVYTVTIMATDETGNTGQATVSVTVPKELPASVCIPSPAGLTGWWPGDSNTNDIIGGRTAVLHGDAKTGAGYVGGAFILDGDGDFVDVPHDPALDVGTGDFTVSLWIFFNDTAGEQILIEKWIQRFESPGEGWTLTKLENNSLTFGMDSGIEGESGSIDSSILPLAARTWNHFAVTRQGTLITTFMNGVPLAQYNFELNLNSNSSLKFGHRGSPSDTPGSEDERGFYLNGRVDEVQIFVGQALTTQQIRAIFEVGRVGMCK